MYAIEISQLTKRYPGKKAPALDNLNLTVKRGEIFGYLGPNGAGKSTTIRLMLDLIRPTAGTIRVLDLNAQKESLNVRRLVGNLPGELRLWGHLTGRQTLQYLASLRPGCDMTYAYALAERLQLDLDIRAANYSTGNKRKVGIIQAMMHRPPLLILDEPTTGLDPLMRHVFNDLLREARAAGQTVFLSSHVLPEVQAVCDRVGIIRAGTLRMVEEMHHLQNNVARIVTLVTKDRIPTGLWTDMIEVKRVENGEGYVRLHVNGSLDGVVKQAAHYTIDDLRVEFSGLEQIFMEYFDD